MKKRFLFINKGQSMILFAVVSLMLGAFYTAISSPCISHVAHTTSVPLQSPSVLVTQQPDTPLGLSVVKSNLATTRTLGFEVIVENDSVQSIRAYAIRYERLSGNSKAGGAELTNKMSTSSVLQPGQSESVYLGKDIFQSDTIDNITIFVDFAEFMDGTTWGPDISKSKERLLGLRAGARAATRHFLGVLKQDGPQAVISLVKDGTANISPRSNHLPEWLDGFRAGIGAICGRLESTYTKSGLPEIESELGRPFDASEGRR